jgi:hypothetical protein
MMMKKLLLGILGIGLLAGCGGPDTGATAEPEAEAPLLTVEAPEPIAVPEPVEVSSDEDWEAKVHNKEIEVLQVINIINPIAVYITEGFNQHGDDFSEILNEEWEDTQVQLTAALTLYDSCKERMAAGAFEKQLFLDMEEVWQGLVKTGVAGVRTNQMVDSEIRRMTR